MFEFPFHVRVQQRGVAFAPAPEDVVFAAEFDGRVNRGFDLRRAMRQHMKIRVRRSAVHIARMRKKIGRAPQQLDPGVCLFLFRQRDDFFQIRFRFFNRISFRRDVAVMEAIKRSAEFADEFESGV